MFIMRYRLVLLDIDGTLYDNTVPYMKALEKVYDYVKERYPLLTRETFLEVYEEARRETKIMLSGTASGHNRFLYFQRMMEKLGLTLEPRVLLHMNTLYWNTVFKEMKPFPGVVETLKTLKEHNIRIGVVTNMLAIVQAEKLRRLGVDRYVDFMVTSEEAGRDKPHPSPFLLALQKGDHTPEETVMVGDDESKDIEGAKMLGITTVLLGEGEADYVISDFRELVHIVLGEERRRRVRRRLLIIRDAIAEEVGEIEGWKMVTYGEKGTFRLHRRPIVTLEQILHSTATSPWLTVVVDSDERVLRAARRLLLKTVLWGESIHSFIPDYIVKNRDELVSLLSGSLS